MTDTANKPLKPHGHCHRCGAKYLTLSWPRICPSCKGMTWKNPLPVAVALVPVTEGGKEIGVMGVHRTIHPQGDALPGGYVDAQEKPKDAPEDWHSETWQEAVVREVFEETGLMVSLDSVELFNAESAPDGTILMFATTSSVTRDMVKASAGSDETSGAFVIYPGDESALIFDLHADAVEAYFGG